MGKSLDGKELGQGIVQKKNGKYEARFTNRFGKRISFSGKDLKDVKRRFNEAIYENSQEINIKDNIKLDVWYSKWMNVYKYNTIRENSKMHYNQVYMKHISPVLGNFYLKDITQLQIRELIKKLNEDGYSYETQNKVKILLTDMFNKAMIDDFVKKNPTKGISVKRDENKEIKVLSEEEQISFFDCCKGTFYDNFFNVAISTGMRIGELAALTWDDIDWDKMVVSVKRTLVYQKYETDEGKTFHIEPPKTKTSYREIPINRQCEAALKKQYIQKNVIMRKAPDAKKIRKEFEGFLFTTKFNTPLNASIISDAIKRIIDEINSTRDVTEEMENFSCHCFRHTFATRCFEAGIQPKTVQSYLGHATLQMTMDLYTSVLPKHKSSEMSKLENRLEEIEAYGNDISQKKYEEFFKNNCENVIKFGDIVAI